jgi:putative FmdB family regulatory protein
MKRRMKMAIYDYKCDSCSLEVIDQRSIHQELKSDDCPVSDCQGKLKQTYNRLSVSFKGSGFYSNDKKVVKGD